MLACMARMAQAVTACRCILLMVTALAVEVGRPMISALPLAHRNRRGKAMSRHHARYGVAGNATGRAGVRTCVGSAGGEKCGRSGATVGVDDDTCCCTPL